MYSAVGDYDVTIPEGTAAGMYKIRVGSFADSEVYACSDEFEVLGDGDSPSMSYRF